MVCTSAEPLAQTKCFAGWKVWRQDNGKRGPMGGFCRCPRDQVSPLFFLEVGAMGAVPVGPLYQGAPKIIDSHITDQFTFLLDQEYSSSAPKASALGFCVKVRLTVPTVLSSLWLCICPVGTPDTQKKGGWQRSEALWAPKAA